MKTYLVGGAIRDKLLGLRPKDFDYVIVGATDEDVASMIDEGYKQVGKSFPVFLHPISGSEYAFARVERKVGPGYNGFQVDTKDVTLTQDLARRDLTINSMASDVDTGEFFDPYGGLIDLKNGIIRHTTAAFAEDPLRVFRVAKFVSRLGFTVDESTVTLMKQITASGELEYLAKERLLKEMLLVISGKHSVAAFQMLFDIGALEVFCPILNDIFSSKGALKHISLMLEYECESAEEKLGWLLGYLANAYFSDYFFDKLMDRMHCSLKTKKMAHAVKECDIFNVGNLIHKPTTILHTLKIIKQLEFLEETKFNKTFMELSKFVATISGNSDIDIDFVEGKFQAYASAIKDINQAAIAERFTVDGKTDGKRVGEQILNEKIQKIEFVNELWDTYRNMIEGVNNDN